MKTDFREGILEVLDRSRMPLKDRELWLRLLEVQSDIIQVWFLKIFYGHENMLTDITENLHLKMDLSKDASLKETLYEQEKKMLESVLGVQRHLTNE